MYLTAGLLLTEGSIGRPTFTEFNQVRRKRVIVYLTKLPGPLSLMQNDDGRIRDTDDPKRGTARVSILKRG